MDIAIVDTAIADIHPIGSRVRLILTDAYGTVRAWGYAAPHFHVVDLDDGMRVAVAGAALERARARRDWAEHAIVLERGGLEARP